MRGEYEQHIWYIKVLEPGVTDVTYNNSTWESEAGGSLWVQGQPRLSSEFETSLGYRVNLCRQQQWNPRKISSIQPLISETSSSQLEFSFILTYFLPAWITETLRTMTIVPHGCYSKRGSLLGRKSAELDMVMTPLLPCGVLDKLCDLQLLSYEISKEIPSKSSFQLRYHVTWMFLCTMTLA